MLKYIFLYLLMATISCGEPSVLDSSTLRRMPKNPKWRLKGYLNNSLKIIDVNCIYINIDKKYNSNSFLRFWKNGRVMQGFGDVKNYFRHANSFFLSNPGYYVILNGNTILTEFFGRTGYKVDYFYEFYKITGDNIILTQSRFYTDKSRKIVFKKSCSEKLTTNPDW
ncbi:hypothetical protein KKF34_02035 [Myxococcota bacterium]|nr:hypothetical protein [Myxococcota bacterium]MBU1495640.1 hypothetical protein [Myxococcota bacterium]